ncbi:TPA: PTS sugar transporter subunit IIA [Salmonella enterica]|uniref:PTS sugar transporter subunit IIA n=1 Tax=Salmonella enterica TaxID=28901 RepID=UPI000FB56B06|nr:PTS sugar transporter subunit IIA [Salmonella enterica]ECE0111472.1 PTS sugar transporter subunit IIA [Salmonella enterica subsp. diarizonae]EAQ6115050.1 PTS sugar transporter subunit IIA [Salmonella enterica]ECC6251069.1 PTS sugar transporter subunit IIA [Salmonella enterica]ECF6072238.1 PTS sugar transporter subunit IIA [Salmonella enterica subsp. diarizonae]
MMFSAQRVVKFTGNVSRMALLTRLAESLQADGLVKPSFADGVLEREKVYPTGIFMETHSVAIPHTEFEHVNQTGFAIGINLAGVEFQRTDEPDESVVPQIVVMMAIDKTCEKVAIIQSLFALLADRDRVNDIVKMTPEEIAKVFTDAVVTQ